MPPVGIGYRRRKGQLYDRWSREWDVNRPAIKDQVMKGFDRAQGIPPSGEAAVHGQIRELLSASRVPYWADKVPIDRRNVADFVLGYSSGLITHVCELESVRTWERGLGEADR